MRASATPFRAFMRANVRDKDLRLFEDCASGRSSRDLRQRRTRRDIEMRVLIPAFMIPNCGAASRSAS